MQNPSDWYRAVSFLRSAVNLAKSIRESVRRLFGMDSRSSGDAPARYARPNAVRTIGLAMPMSGRALVGRVLDDGLDHDDIHFVAQTERHRAAGVPSQFQHQRPGK